MNPQIPIWLALAAIAAAISIWWSICTERTTRDRLSLWRAVSPQYGSFEKDVAGIRSVSYQMHFWMRFTGRDPAQLYPEHLRPAIKPNRNKTVLSGTDKPTWKENG